jgi:hypothetical protein
MCGRFQASRSAEKVALYFLPWIIAGKRSHHQHGAIAVINIFLGWTFLDWVIALAMACSALKPAVVPAAGAPGGTRSPRPFTPRAFVPRASGSPANRP